MVKHVLVLCAFTEVIGVVLAATTDRGDYALPTDEIGRVTEARIKLALVLFGWAIPFAAVVVIPVALVWWVGHLAWQTRPRRKPALPKGASAFFEDKEQR